MIDLEMIIKNRMEKLTFKNGRFWRGEVNVPVEIGNSEQIKLLKEYEQSIQELEENAALLKKEGLEIELTGEVKSRVEVEGSFKCPCSRTVYVSDEIEDCDDEGDGISKAMENIDGRTTQCPQCKKQYRYSVVGGILYVLYK